MLQLNQSGSENKTTHRNWEDLNSFKMKDVMTPVPLTVDEDTKITKARQIFRERKIRHLPVVSQAQQGKLVGILSERDTRLIALMPDISRVAVADLMTRNPLTVPEGMPAPEAISKMVVTKFGCLIVMSRTGGIAGIFTVQDALRLLLHERKRNIPMAQTYPLPEEDDTGCDDDDCLG